MICANVAVAEALVKKRRPTLFRIHDQPGMEKLEALHQFLRSFDLSLPRGVIRTSDFNRILQAVAGQPHQALVNQVVLRSQAQAAYSPDNIGHFGLNLDRYAHFTSPIRRYADLVVHRSLFDKVELQTSVAKQIADHISATEKNSADAERDSKDVKLYAFLKAQIASKKPQHYAALVTDVRNFGFFVDVTYLGMSGGVPLSAIPDDFFVFDPANSQLVGRHTRRVIRLGDNVVVQIYKVDSVKKQVDFQLVPSRERPARQDRS